MVTGFQLSEMEYVLKDVLRTEINAPAREAVPYLGIGQKQAIKGYICGYLGPTTERGNFSLGRVTCQNIHPRPLKLQGH